MKKIRTLIIGVGNCAKSLVEGVHLYSMEGTSTNGLMFPVIGGYEAQDIEFCGGIDVDSRKVGVPLNKAIYAAPNCAKDISNRSLIMRAPSHPVGRGPVFDGVPEHMMGMGKNQFDAVSSRNLPLGQLKQGVSDYMDAVKPDAALIYLPVGSGAATRFYVEMLLEKKIPFVNCIPEFIVSDPTWGKRIQEAGIPAIGDDMRSQVGASIMSQVLQEMFLDRGAKVKFHCQTNQGGNTDFYNMTDASRLVSKKKSKENVVRSQNTLRGIKTENDSIHAGPSDYIPYLGDNKVAQFRIEAEGFGGAEITFDGRLSVQDSPNSAGVVIDALRYLATARDNGYSGPLHGPSAATQKTPPVQMKWVEAYAACLNWAKNGAPGESVVV